MERAGFIRDRSSGSHVTLVHPGTGRSVTVAVHGAQDLPLGTLRGIIRDAGLTVEEFVRLLK